MRRTLIIGLGSTGRDVCDDIITRIVWSGTNDDLSHRPWVDFLVFETERKDGILSSRFGKYVSLVPDHSEINKMVASPADYDAQLDLQKWSDPILIKGLDDLSDGAGGTRMKGRLAFLAPSVYHQVKKAIQGALKSLMRVSESDVNAQFPSMAGNITLDQKVQVCMIGTLCGGTASGAFLDAAHLVRHIAHDLGYQIDIDGYFTLPGRNVIDPIQRANTFAALREWNHFLTLGTTYHVRYPDGNGHDYVAPQPMPFDNSCLLQTSAAVEPDTLNRNLGDYIFSLATSVDFSAISGKDVDWEPYQPGLDKEGSNRRWSTLGIRTLNFPAERLVEGCSLYLVSRTLERLLSPASSPVPGTILDKVGLTPQSLNKSLGVDQLKQNIYERIDGQSEPLPIQVAQTLALAEKPESRPGLVGLLTGHVTTVLGGEINKIRLAIINKIGTDDVVSARLSLQKIVQQLEQLRREVNQELKRAKDGHAASVVASSKAALEECLNAPPPSSRTGLFGIFKTKPQKSDRLRQGNTLLKDLVCAVIDEHVEDVCRIEIYNAALSAIETFIERINGKGDRPGVIQHLETTRDLVNARLKTVRADLARVQMALVIPADIDQQYDQLLTKNASGISTVEEVERNWQDDLARSLNIIPDELVKEPTKSTYDAVVDSNELRQRAKATERLLTQTARRKFDSAITNSIVDNLSAPDAALRWLGECNESLDFNRNATSQQPVEPKQDIGFVFYDMAAAAASDVAKLNQFENALQRCLPKGGRLMHVDAKNPDRISYVKLFGAFSINALDGMGYSGQFRQAYNTKMTDPGLNRHARKDISWIPIGKADLGKFNQACNMFLAGISAGVIKSLGSTRFQFEYRIHGPETLPLNSLQWMDNGAKLYENPVTMHQLRMQLEEWLKKPDIGPAGVVEEVRKYSDGALKSSGLWDGGKPLASDIFLQAAFQFWRQYRDVEQEFYRLEREIDPAQMYFVKAAEELTPGHIADRDGCYCPECRTWLGPNNDDNVLYNPCRNCLNELLSKTRKL